MENQVRRTLAEGLAQLPHQGKRFVPVFNHGSLLVEIYAPRGSDPQQPHTRDEIYVVAGGSGVFVTNDRRQPFQPTDLLFVPADAEHRFEEFSDDLALWVIFYGPEGGEATTAV